MKALPINPMLIHTIQDRILALKGNSILEIALYNSALTGIRNSSGGFHWEYA